MVWVYYGLFWTTCKHTAGWYDEYILYVTVNSDGISIQSQPNRRTGHTRWHDELSLLLEQLLAVCCPVATHHGTVVPKIIPICSFYPFTADNLRNQEIQVMKIVKRSYTTEICIESIVKCAVKIVLQPIIGFKIYIIECLQLGSEKEG
jgi:hypothetical protein